MGRRSRPAVFIFAFQITKKALGFLGRGLVAETDVSAACFWRVSGYAYFIFLEDVFDGILPSNLAVAR